ncbi:TetR/AcrR family transcriptional regulator [Nocardia abscessus]|uniref:TetR/AcrR family transcriptional regulator n=1 Tax=Nocardia abscessus TaxID=120957 RepID=UPI0024580DEA|nr:TetR/AcrR family transcriptional regulator [Nocardia abscessus]
MPESQRGRPRSASVHQAILDSARDLLAAVGYEQMTIEAIAAGAGVGKQTVYRRWRSKAAVVAEAVLDGYLISAAEPLPDSGDIAADLRKWLRELSIRHGEPAAAALIRGLAAAAADSQADAERLYDRLTGPARQQLMHRLDAGVQQGQLRAGADLDAATDAIIGTLLYRVLARRPPFPHDGVDGLLDVLLLGLARDH